MKLLLILQKIILLLLDLKLIFLIQVHLSKGHKKYLGIMGISII